MPDYSPRCTFRAVGMAMLAVSMGSTSAHAQDFFAAPRDFVIDKACDAHA